MKHVRYDWQSGVWIEACSPLSLPHETHWRWSLVHKSWLRRYKRIRMKENESYNRQRKNLDRELLSPMYSRSSKEILRMIFGGLVLFLLPACLIVLMFMFMFVESAEGAAPEVIKPTQDLHVFAIEIHVVSEDRMVSLQKKWTGAYASNRDLHRGNSMHGLTLLGKKNGQRTCIIYIVDEPDQVDDRETTTLGHELLHCMKGDYHR